MQNILLSSGSNTGIPFSVKNFDIGDPSLQCVQRRPRRQLNGDQNILEYQGNDSEIFDEKKTVITCHLILCTHKFEYLLPDVTKWVIRTLPNIYHGPFF